MLGFEDSPNLHELSAYQLSEDFTVDFSERVQFTCSHAFINLVNPGIQGAEFDDFSAGGSDVAAVGGAAAGIEPGAQAGHFLDCILHDGA